MSKTCTKCKTEKSLLDFYKDSRQNSGLRPSCKKCDAQNSYISLKRRRKENPEKYRGIARRDRKQNFLKSLGMTLSDYEVILSAQNNLCAICQQENNNQKDWHIDHDHRTNKFRGILCHHCNLLLGNAKDNILTLENAIRYLRGTDNE